MALYDMIHFLSFRDPVELLKNLIDFLFLAVGSLFPSHTHLITKSEMSCNALNTHTGPESTYCMHGRSKWHAFKVCALYCACVLLHYNGKFGECKAKNSPWHRLTFFRQLSFCFALRLCTLHALYAGKCIYLPKCILRSCISPPFSLFSFIALLLFSF